MVITTHMLSEELRGYANPQGKIAHMVKRGELVPLVRGLYETDRNAAGECLAGCLCGPSYLSFEYALAWHGLIPERVSTYTSATCGKRKVKRFENFFGRYEYRDVPQAVFAIGVDLHRGSSCPYWIASPEKALCDQLHKLPPAENYGELEELLFGSLRLDEDRLWGLSADLLSSIEGRYRCRNVSRLVRYLERGIR